MSIVIVNLALNVGMLWFLRRTLHQIDERLRFIEELFMRQKIPLKP